MPTPVNETGPAELWIEKDEAARRLNVSKRQLERRAQQGLIRRQYPDTEPRRVLFSAADIEKLAAGAKFASGAAKPLSLTATPGLDVATSPGDAMTLARDPFESLAAALTRAFPPFAPLPAIGRWITLDEAAKRSGLPRAWLLAQARAGALFARNVGTGKRASWRFNGEGL